MKQCRFIIFHFHSSEARNGLTGSKPRCEQNWFLPRLKGEAGPYLCQTPEAVRPLPPPLPSKAAAQHLQISWLSLLPPFMRPWHDSGRPDSYPGPSLLSGSLIWSHLQSPFCCVRLHNSGAWGVGILGAYSAFHCTLLPPLKVNCTRILLMPTRVTFQTNRSLLNYPSTLRDQLWPGLSSMGERAVSMPPWVCVENTERI